jgi:hypothetical protein
MATGQAIGTGAGIGASIGSIIPGLGTAVGGLVGAGVGGLVSLIGGLSGMVKANKAKQTQKNFQSQWDTMNAQRPTLQPQTGYKDIVTMYESLKAGRMPGMEQTIGQLGQTTAKGLLGAERGAISSSAYQSSVQNIMDKEMETLRDLGIKEAQYKTDITDRIAGAKLGYMDENKRVEDWNVLGKWTTGMNQLESQMGQNMTNQENASNTMWGSLSNLAGTSYYMQALKSMQPQYGKTGAGNPSLDAWSKANLPK